MQLQERFRAHCVKWLNKGRLFIVNAGLGLGKYFHWMTFILSYSRGLKSALIFDGIEEALKNDGASLVKKVKGIFGFKVKDTNGKEHLWIVDAKNGDGKVEFNGKGT